MKRVEIIQDGSSWLVITSESVHTFDYSYDTYIPYSVESALNAYFFPKTSVAVGETEE